MCLDFSGVFTVFHRCYKCNQEQFIGRDEEEEEKKLQIVSVQNKAEEWAQNVSYLLSTPGALLKAFFDFVTALSTFYCVVCCDGQEETG